MPQSYTVKHTVLKELSNIVYDKLSYTHKYSARFGQGIDKECNIYVNILYNMLPFMHG